MAPNFSALSDGAGVFQSAFAHSAIGVAITDIDGRFLRVNAAYCAITGYSEEQLGATDEFAITHPGDRDESEARRRLRAQGALPNTIAEKRYLRPDGVVVWVRISTSVVRDAEGSVDSIIYLVEDWTERRRSAEAVQAADRRLSDVLDNITDAFCTFDHEWRFTYANESCERLLQKRKAELIGGCIWDMFPNAEETIVYSEYHRAVVEQIPVVFEVHYPPLGGWFEVHAYPSADGLSAYFHDINIRKQAEAVLQENTRLITLAADVGTALATRFGIDEMLQGCCAAIVAHLELAAARIWIHEPDAGVLALAAAVGASHAVDGQQTHIPVGQQRVGRIALYRSPSVGASTPQEDGQSPFAAGGACAGYPLIVDDEVVGVIEAISEGSMPIASLRALESVVDEIAIGIQRKRTESTLVAAHARLAEALETMTDGFYATDENFCFTYVNRVAEDWWGVRRENILGRELWHVFPETVGTESQKRLLVAMNERRTVQFEGLSATTGQWTEATIIPTSGGVSVYFRDITLRRQKELARDEMLQYEQNIARQLQQALQPQLPEGLPGLALSHYYKPALPEAGVGGDFYDAFVIDKGCAVLVVGDLSGKGLAAATQVATIRNMLRYALYNQRTLVDAVNTLNDTLAEYKLLTGFATLFVGCYDSGEQTLTYVNCGQEPALIRRAATGEIEALHPTGTVLGSFSGTQFQELVVPMSNDDAIAIFTDGFTESGPTRRELLGIEGVTDILKRPLDEGPGNTFDLATELSRRLVSEVTTYARDGASDDMCLLVAVANQPAFV